MIWISTWRGSRTYFSTETVGSPKAERAALRLLSIADPSSLSFSTTFMPMPPPPPEGFTMTGKPISRAARAAASESSRAPVPGVTGTPWDSARARASTLEPMARIAAARGAMKAVAGGPRGVRRRSDEGDAGGRARLRKLRPLGEEPVAGVDRLGPDVTGQFHDLLQLEVRLGRSRRADVVGLVG